MTTSMSLQTSSHSYIIVCMELFLFVIVLLELAVLVIFDFLNRRERNDLTLKLMSKDLGEYKSATLPKQKATKEEPDPYVDPMDVDPEKILKAKDQT